ncbi:MAG: amino acid adenylation domain-containing protein, partial [Desulfobacterales bacterium]|nr:amino acid adenylation domain-containing protein [Desulfobacterales bacterium]
MASFPLNKGLSARNILLHLIELGVNLSVDGEQLKCKAPKGVLTPLILQQLKDYKSEIINLLHDAHLKLDDKIPLVSREIDLPLSFAQQRLWFLEQLEGASSIYNVSEAVRLKGNLNLSILEQVFSEISKRHEILRTTFPNLNGKPMQVISQKFNSHIKFIEISKLSDVTNLMEQESSHTFDLAKGPLHRIIIFRLQEEFILQIIMHHIIYDAWSMNILLKEFSILYNAFCEQKKPSLPDLPIQYADFAYWQRKWLTGKVLEKQVSFWKEHLKDAPSLIELPFDRPRPSMQTFRGANEHLEITLELYRKLYNLSKRFHTTLFTILMAAWNVLMSHYSGQDNIIIGTPIANRHRSETEHLIGFFVNTLAIHTDLSGNPTFIELISRISNVMQEVHDHQDLPFEYLTEILKPERSLSHTPIFQVMFVFNNNPVNQINLFGINSVEWMTSEATKSKFDLTLFTDDTGEELKVWIEYNIDLFDSSTIKRMSEHFLNFLKNIVECPEKSISKIPILSNQELHYLLIELNDTKTDYPKNKSVHELFESQVIKTPEAEAVIFEQKSLSYNELNNRSNQLANYLISLGLKPETKVGICINRSIEMMVGLLGILKAGCAYVPMDPAYPIERLAFMIEDTEMPLLITSSNQEKILNLRKVKAICIDMDWEIIGLQSEENPQNRINPDNIAYVIYTSGSTGMPKGTMISHIGLVNYLSWAIKEYAVSGGIGAPVHSSIGFDATITSLFTPLLSGKKTVLIPEEEEIEKLKQILESENNFSLVKITPAHLEALSHIVDPEKIRGRTRVFVIGGEALFYDTLSFWHKYCSKTRFINEYGPTETVVGCCIYDAKPRLEKASSSIPVPIGKPISNTRLYILDKYLSPVPIGVKGELYIAGDGVAKGYLNRPDLTHEKFIEKKFIIGSLEISEKMYKTGDIARRLSDGNMEYIGRMDNQVKLRGFRIELGEIEASLMGHPDVREAIVMLREDYSSQKKLVAYVVWDKDDSTELEVFLRKTLPEYMVPYSFVSMKKFPLTVNGKIDRKALPAPDNSTRSEYVEPVTEAEKILALIWSELLNIEHVGVKDNFFALGGDSIISIQAVARSASYGLYFTVKEFFQHQTLGAIAACASSKKIKANQGIVTGPVQLTPIQHWFFEREKTAHNHYNQSVVLEVSLGIKPETLEKALEYIILHHDALRMSFTKIPSGWKQENIDNKKAFSFIIASEFESTAQKLQKDLDISNRLVSSAYFNPENKNHALLLIVAHHLVIDSVSWRIIIEDLQTASMQLEKNEPVSLPPKADSFQQWAIDYMSMQVL